jgi:hydroxymethylglutaryl-CoA lyase
MADPVRIFEVGPRDGLQNEKRTVTTGFKVRLIDLLSECGFDRIEAASFVSPARVPQMADSGDVLARIARKPGVRYAALTPNLQGYDRARAARADEIAIFASASEGFSRANLNCTIAESIDRFRPVAARAKADGIPVRGYVSCVTDCPYDGPVAPDAVARVAEALDAMGCYEISLGDTVGRGTPERVSAMLSRVKQSIPPDRLAGHFHDTGGRALDNIRASLGHGLRVFDASVAGLGGCPFAPGATGNVATRAAVRAIEGWGFSTGIDLTALAAAEVLIAEWQAK